MLSVLTALKDIPGVIGSFVLTDDGALVCRDMAAVYPDGIFPELGRRLSGVKQAIETQAPPFTDIMLKFESYWLLNRRASKCNLSILAAQNVNYPALRIATNVALKQIDESTANGLPSASPAAAAPAPEPMKRRFFRGQEIK